MAAAARGSSASDRFFYSIRERRNNCARLIVTLEKEHYMVLLEFHLLLSLSHTLEIYTTKTFLNSWCAMRGILSLWVLCVRAAASSIPFKFQLSRPPTWPACFIRASQWTLLGYNAHKYSYRHAFRSLAAAAAVREQQRDSQCAVDIGYCSAALEEFLI